MVKKKYNWKEIQSYHDDRHTWSEICIKFGCSSNTLYKASKRGDFTSRSRSEACKISARLKPRKHSLETRKKISEIRIKYLRENPDKVPYLLNHHSKGKSYPEKYFTELFDQENIPLIYHHRVGPYELDFCDLELKVDIEVDGEQHYLDKRVVESDKRRNIYLIEREWRIFRIRWSTYSKLKFEEREIFVKRIRKFIGS